VRLADFNPLLGSPLIARWRYRGIVCQCFADEVARETANNNVLPEFRDLGAEQFPDRLIWILDESLLQQTNRAVEFFQFAVDNFAHHRFRFAFDLALINFALGFDQRAGHIITTDVERMRRSDVQGDVLHESTEILVLGHEIGLAIYFHQHPNLPLQMNVGCNNSFLGYPRRFLARARDAFRPQNDFRFRQVAARFGQGALAIHHPRIGSVAKFLNGFWIDLYD
jgi:hypothetical protein